MALAEGPEFDDYASSSGQYAAQALRLLGDRLRERRIDHRPAMKAAC